MSALVELETKLRAKAARAGVVGLGYVGLPLAVEVAQAGFHVVGVDTDPLKVAALSAGRCYVSDVEPAQLAALLSAKRLRASAVYRDLAQCDVVSICVPTPLRKTRDPDLSHVLSAAAELAQHLRSGTLVILESTTFPGMTDRAVLPILERGGLRVGRDFCLCYSPERVDPANRDFGTRNIPKVIGGVTEACLRLGEIYYGLVMDTVVPVSSTQNAEMVKLLENTFRMVNVALVNEVAVLCAHMGIDVWEVIAAAATKPFGYMPFYPGPGLGGHCIPVDPRYLLWRARQLGVEPRFIQLASEVNRDMPKYVVQRIQAILNAQGKAAKGSRIHLIGVAYKRNVADVRESPALDVAALLLDLQAQVSFSDPLVEHLPLGATVLDRQPYPDTALAADLAVILTDHDGVDHRRLLDTGGPLIFDTRNALAGALSPRLERL